MLDLSIWHMTWSITMDTSSYERAYESFTWEQIPNDYNAARDLLRKHENVDRTALYEAYLDGHRETYTFRELDRLSNQLAHGLEDLGIERGDRVGVVAPQRLENPLTHLACWKVGAVSVPLSILFGSEALRYRLVDCGVKTVIVDESVLDTVQKIRGECPHLEHIVSLSAETIPEDVHPFASIREGYPETYNIVDTDPNTTATILYTSGSTGPPKGVVKPHSVWVRFSVPFLMLFELDVSQSICWTPADWAWSGGLGILLFPAWHFGRPVLGCPIGEFEAESAYELLEEFGVTDAFIPPTAIRLMTEIDNPTEQYDLSLDAIASGGEPLTPEILDWADEELAGVTVNELYGQTEANLLTANCKSWFPARPGSMGKPIPGHDVEIIDQETGEKVKPGEIGMIAVREDDGPALFHEYWNKPEKTEEVRLGEWHVTGDLGYMDSDGYFWFKSRDDDVIITAGYRVGPSEVESAILEHPDAIQAGVIGIPHETRNEIIKAFVEPAEDRDRDELRDEIKQHVRGHLAKYEYPREIEFVDELPQTTSGKIQRRKLREYEENS